MMISRGIEDVVLLDACVLVPISLTDLLLRLAETPALYLPRWSNEILNEIERTLQLPRFGLSPERARYRIACMESAFPEATVKGSERLIATMDNDPKDKHVLAAAVQGRATAIVTSNRRDFPIIGIERLTPDQFLLHQWSRSPRLVRRKLEDQAGDSSRTLDQLLHLLAKMVPRFASAVQSG